MRVKVYSYRAFFKTIFFIMGISLASGIFFYIQWIIADLRNENRQVQELYANVLVRLPEVESGEFNFIFEEFIKKTFFPVVITDLQGNPVIWKGIEVEPEDTAPKAIKRVRQIVKILRTVPQPI